MDKPTRRSFFWKLGAGVSTALASTAGLAKAGSAPVDDAALRLALLQEERAIRQLHQSFVHAMDRGLYEQALGLFAGDAQVMFNGGVFDQRSQGVRRLFDGRFRPGKTGGTMVQAPGFELAPDQLRDSVDVAADRRTATAVFAYSIQVGAPLDAGTSLVAMARLHGEGVQTWWEGGVYRACYRKDAADRWMISRLEYDTLSRADYRPGRSYASPMAATPFSRCFPGEQQGPDALVWID